MKRNPTFFVNWDVCRWTVAVAGYEKSWVTLCGFCQPHRSAMGTLIPVGPVFELSAQPNLQELPQLIPTQPTEATIALTIRSLDPSLFTRLIA